MTLLFFIFIFYQVMSRLRTFFSRGPKRSRFANPVLCSLNEFVWHELWVHLIFKGLFTVSYL